jgi:hypothetical protein
MKRHSVRVAQSAADALTYGYELGLAGSGVVLVIAAFIAAALVSGKNGDVSVSNPQLHWTC